MNKLLTTITLLCFSVAANADIYFCESDSSANLIVPTESRYLNNLSEEGDVSIVVDSEKGFRHSEFEEYNGDCEISRIFLVCTFSSEGIGEGTFAIDIKGLSFSYIDHIYGMRLTSRAGTCTKA